MFVKWNCFGDYIVYIYIYIYASPEFFVFVARTKNTKKKRENIATKLDSWQACFTEFIQTN